MKGFTHHAAALLTVAAAAWTSNARADEPIDDFETDEDTTLSQPAPVTPPPPVVVESTPPPAAPPVVVQPAPVPARDIETREEYYPNGGLIVSGAVMLGLTYTTSVIVGAASQYEPDKNLYVPIAGPWIDLAERDDCGLAGTPACNEENTNKVLLVADGIAQGLGALQILGGFVFPSKRTITDTAKPSLRITPRAGKSGYGLSAYGTF